MRQHPGFGLLDISKARGAVVPDRLAELLANDGAVVPRCVKPTFARPAPVDLRHEIATQCEVVIGSLADFERRSVVGVFLASEVLDLAARPRVASPPRTSWFRARSGTAPTTSRGRSPMPSTRRWCGR